MWWIPADEAELQVALDEGNVRENQSLDFKQETGNGDGSRRETARDLASFAVDGGQLVIGVAEDKANLTFSLEPQPLEGAAEKLEDIARNRIDPPLFIRVHDIPSEADPLRGYLFVDIPASPAAPHMVDGRYYARGDRTKRVLRDTEVALLHARRRDEESTLRDSLANWVERAIVSPSRRQNGHFHALAEPLAQANPTALQSLARSADATKALNFVRDVVQSLPGELRFEPNIGSGNRWGRRPDGGALTTLPSGVPRLESEGYENGLVDLELHDNGGARVTMGRLTGTTGRFGTDVAVVFDVAAVSYAWSVVLLARAVAHRTGYRGPWGFAVHADEIAHARSFAVTDNESTFGPGPEPYGADTYTEVTTAQLHELEDAPGAVAERLVGRLLHGLGSHTAFEGDFA